MILILVQKSVKSVSIVCVLSHDIYDSGNWLKNCVQDCTVCRFRELPLRWMRTLLDASPGIVDLLQYIRSERVISHRGCIHRRCARALNQSSLLNFPVSSTSFFHMSIRPGVTLWGHVHRSQLIFVKALLQVRRRSPPRPDSIFISIWKVIARSTSAVLLRA